MDYTDLIADTTGLHDGYTAPEVACERAAASWMRRFEESGLVSLAGEMNKAHPQGDGSWILGWIVGEDEFYYYVIFNPAKYSVFTEKRGKAVKGG